MFIEMYAVVVFEPTVNDGIIAERFGVVALNGINNADEPFASVRIGQIKLSTMFFIGALNFSIIASKIGFHVETSGGIKPQDCEMLPVLFVSPGTNEPVDVYVRVVPSVETH